MRDCAFTYLPSHALHFTLPRTRGLLQKMCKHFDKMLLHLLQLSKNGRISAVQMRAAVEALVSMVRANAELPWLGLGLGSGSG